MITWPFFPDTTLHRNARRASAETHIVIIDDMITAGAHLKAMSRVLRERFPGVPISGVFLAKRVIPDDNEEKS